MASPTDLSGLFKVQYADSLKNLVPESTKFVKMVPFEERAKLGKSYDQPVIVSEEGGFSHAPADAGAFTLQTDVPLNTQNASVTASQFVLSSSIDYESASRAASSKAAFMEVMSLKVKSMTSSSRKRLESSLLWGRRGLGVVQSVSNPSAGTTATVTIKIAEHAPLLWAGSKGKKISFFSSGGNTLIKDSGGTGVFTIVSVDVTNSVRTLLISGSNADLVALYAQTAASPDIFWHTTRDDSGGHQDMLGIVPQVLQQSSTVFGIDVGTYDLFRGNAFSVGGALNFKGVQDAVSVAVNRGLESDVMLTVHPATWSNLMNDLAALRRIDGSFDPSKLENGAKALAFHSLNGKITVQASGYMKGGYALIQPDDVSIRVGSTDISFETPGRAGEIFVPSTTTAGYFLRCYSNQAQLTTAPAHCVVLTGIVNA